MNGFNLLILQLRVVKAFRSTLDEFDERRSTASSQSLHSMRGLTGITVPARLSNGPAQLTDGLVGFNRRVSNMYVYTHPHRSLANQASNTSTHPNGHTGCNVSTVVVENGRYGACGGRFDQPAPPLSPTTASTNMAAYLPADKVEKIPLVQQWSPSSGVRSSVNRHIGKSMSLDNPVSIAHV
jgi:hypothetical protein